MRVQHLRDYFPVKLGILFQNIGRDAGILEVHRTATGNWAPWYIPIYSSLWVTSAWIHGQRSVFAVPRLRSSSSLHFLVLGVPCPWSSLTENPLGTFIWSESIWHLSNQPGQGRLSSLQNFPLHLAIRLYYSKHIFKPINAPRQLFRKIKLYPYAQFLLETCRKVDFLCQLRTGMQAMFSNSCNISMTRRFGVRMKRTPRSHFYEIAGISDRECLN
jgi:hypothetical protein